MIRLRLHFTIDFYMQCAHMLKVARGMFKFHFDWIILYYCSFLSVSISKQF